MAAYFGGSVEVGSHVQQSFNDQQTIVFHC